MADKRRLAVVCLSARGLVQYTHSLCRELCKHFDLTIYLSERNFMLHRFRSLNARIREYPTYSTAFELVSRILIPRTIRKIAFDINRDGNSTILDTGAGFWGEPVKRFARQLNSSLKTFDVVHDVEFHPDRHRIYSRIAETVFPRCADAYIGLSKVALTGLAKRFPNSIILESKLGADFVETIDIETRAQLRSKLLFFGRLEAYKGIAILLKAYEAVRENTEATLTIAGSGPLSTSELQSIERLGVRLVHRWISEEDAHSILNSHGTMVMPYLSATQSAVATTAIEYHMPCIATDVGAIKEQIVHSQNGLIVPSNDVNALAFAMKKVIMSEALALELARGASSIADELAWCNVAEKLASDLTQVIDRKFSRTST